MSSPTPTPPSRDPFMTLHTALVLLIAIVIGLVVGGLAFVSTRDIASAVLAGLMAAGTSVPVLRFLIHY